MPLLSKLFHTRNGKHNKKTKATANSSTVVDDFLVVDQVDAKPLSDGRANAKLSEMGQAIDSEGAGNSEGNSEGNSKVIYGSEGEEEWNVVPEDEGDDLYCDHGPVDLKKEDITHQEWLGFQEHTRTGIYIVIELGRRKILKRIPIDKVPQGSRVLMEVAQRPHMTRNIWIKDLDVDEYWASLTQASNSRTKEDIGTKDDWTQIFQLFIAACQLADPIAQTTALSAVRYKAKYVEDKRGRMFNAKDIEYVYAKTQCGSRLRQLLVDLALRSHSLLGTLTGPTDFLREVHDEWQKHATLNFLSLGAEELEFQTSGDAKENSHPLTEQKGKHARSTEQLVKHAKMSQGDKTHGAAHRYDDRMKPLGMNADTVSHHSLVTNIQGSVPMLSPFKSAWMPSRRALSVKSPNTHIRHTSSILEECHLNATPDKQTKCNRQFKLHSGDSQLSRPRSMISLKPETSPLPTHTGSLRAEPSSTLRRQPSSRWANSALRGQLLQPSIQAQKRSGSDDEPFQYFFTPQKWEPIRQPRIPPPLEMLVKDLTSKGTDYKNFLWNRSESTI